MTMCKNASKTTGKKNGPSRVANGRPQHTKAARQARTSGKQPRRVTEDYDPQWTDEEDNLRRDEGSDEVDDEEPREWDEEDHEERAIDAAEEDDDDRSVDRDEDDYDEDDDEEDDEDDEEDDGDVASPSFVQLPSPGDTSVEVLATPHGCRPLCWLSRTSERAAGSGQEPGPCRCGDRLASA